MELKTLVKTLRPNSARYRKTRNMAWRGSFSRSFISAARATASRSSPTNRMRSPFISSPRRFSFSNPRTIGELGCTQSLMPLHNMLAGTRLTSHLAVNVRACCELYHGT